MPSYTPIRHHSNCFDTLLSSSKALQLLLDSPLEALKIISFPPPPLAPALLYVPLNCNLLNNNCIKWNIFFFTNTSGDQEQHVKVRAEENQSNFRQMLWIYRYCVAAKQTSDDNVSVEETKEMRLSGTRRKGKRAGWEIKKLQKKTS